MTINTRDRVRERVEFILHLGLALGLGLGLPIGIDSRVRGAKVTHKREGGRNLLSLSDLGLEVGLKLGSGLG